MAPFAWPQETRRWTSLFPMSAWSANCGSGKTDKYRDHLLRLDAPSRRNRFGGAVSDDRIRDHVETSIGLNAVLHGFFVDGVLRGAAELRLIGSRFFSREAEAAFSVEAPWQSHGVGSVLLERTLLAARNRGIKRLQMACLADNRRMRAAGAQIRRRVVVRFRQHDRRGRERAPDAAVVLCANRGRRRKPRHRDARSAIATAQIRT